MCRSASDVAYEAERCGWFGINEGFNPEDKLVFYCGKCQDPHMAVVAVGADDVDYYQNRCDYIRQCQMGST